MSRAITPIAGAVRAGAVVCAIATNAHAVPIDQPDYVGVYTDTVGFSASTAIPIGSGYDDMNASTVADQIGDHIWSIDGFELMGSSFSLSTLDPDYTVAFPGPGVYSLQFIYRIDALDATTFDPVTDFVVIDTRTITLVPAPGALALLPATGALALARRRR